VPELRRAARYDTNSVNQRCIALLGRRDESAAAVEGYYRHPGRALCVFDVSIAIERVNWRGRAGLRHGEICAQVRRAGEGNGNCPIYGSSVVTAWISWTLPQGAMRAAQRRSRHRRRISNYLRFGALIRALCERIFRLFLVKHA